MKDLNIGSCFIKKMHFSNQEEKDEYILVNALKRRRYIISKPV